MSEVLSSPAMAARRDALVRLAPGIILSAVVAIVAVLLSPYMPRALPLPAMVVALLIGMALHPVASGPICKPGMTFSVKVLLRWAGALLGVRVALGDIVALGPATAALIVLAMLATLVGTVGLSRLFKLPDTYGVLAGVATAVCGASATLATSTVVPDYKNKDSDIAFVVVGVNLLATLGMLVYPPLCQWLGFDDRATGTMLGGTIHDVAQVVGAGYAVSDGVGNSAVIVKLFRVFLLLPVVLAIGWHFTRSGKRHGAAKVPVPMFALAFLALCILNSLLTPMLGLAPVYGPVKWIMTWLSTAGLLLAIAALGLGTSFGTLLSLGWRYIATLVSSAVLILAVVTVGLMVIG